MLSAGEIQNREVEAGHKTVELIDGASYKVTAETGADMFKVVDCTLVSTKDKGMEAVITLSKQGYDYLYMGKAEEAAKADKNNWIPFNEVNGKYTYTIPVKALNTGIEVASHSKKYNKWYDRTITFKSEGMQFQGLKEDSYEYVKDAANQVYTVTTDPGMFSVTEATLSTNSRRYESKSYVERNWL